MKSSMLLAAAALLVGLAGGAFAVSVETTVTPANIKDQMQGRLTVSVTDAGGLAQFTIRVKGRAGEESRFLQQPTLILVKDGKTLARCPVARMEEKGDVVFSFSVSANLLDNFRFELADIAHIKQKDKQGKEEWIGMPSGNFMTFPLGAFVKQRKAKTASPPDKKQPQGPPRIDVIGAGETALEIARTTKDSDAKWMAIRILGNLRYERAIPLLLASLSDPHHYVRSNAARALGDMRVKAAAKPLTRLLKTEVNGGVVQQTSLALTLLRHSDALPALKAAAKHEDVQTRMWVLQAIGGLGGKNDVAFLARSLLNDPSSSVQRSAAQAIEQITGADFGFPRRSGPSDPDAGLKQARTWWEKHKGEFKEQEQAAQEGPLTYGVTPWRPGEPLPPAASGETDMKRDSLLAAPPGAPGRKASDPLGSLPDHRGFCLFDLGEPLVRGHEQGESPLYPPVQAICQRERERSPGRRVLSDGPVAEGWRGLFPSIRQADRPDGVAAAGPSLDPGRASLGVRRQPRRRHGGGGLLAGLRPDRHRASGPGPGPADGPAVGRGRRGHNLLPRAAVPLPLVFPVHPRLLARDAGSGFADCRLLLGAAAPALANGRRLGPLRGNLRPDQSDCRLDLGTPVLAGRAAPAMRVPPRPCRAGRRGRVGPVDRANYLVFGRMIPIKSNLAYEIYQSHCLQKDGLLQGATFRFHPYGGNRRERQEYNRLGEPAYLDRKRQQVWEAFRADPRDFLDRVARRFVGATLWYVPFSNSEARQFLPFWLSRLTHPLPFLALLLLLGSAIREPLAWPQWTVIGVYLLYLLPYVGASYYERYALPLLGAKVLLMLWAGDRVLGWRPMGGRSDRGLFREAGGPVRDASHGGPAHFTPAAVEGEGFRIASQGGQQARAQS